MLPIEGMPNVPNFKGLNAAGSNALISLGSAALINAVFGNYWGIFNEYGIPILLADNVISLKYNNSSRIAQAPIEKGSFASYNKIANPYKATVQLSKGTGGTLMRGAFLGQIETLANSTLLFHILTPEYVYTNACIVGYDTAREASDGAQLIKVNLHLEEVREVTVKYDTEEVKNPDDAKTQDGGEKQPESANESILYKAGDISEDLFKWLL
ncbi:phage baseplate protein [Snodgrassella alvi]|uniref:phage baseplate protein n=1 Tax=Snodgrassella TaxID=1193515 RepID=UPI00226AF2B1|nr:hypothetical protein [Snodgrassella sp. B3088]MCX8748207.1 hypothetical protein [Snodgrassella sp. B3088]